MENGCAVICAAQPFSGSIPVYPTGDEGGGDQPHEEEYHHIPRGQRGVGPNKSEIEGKQNADDGTDTGQTRAEPHRRAEPPAAHHRFGVGAETLPAEDGGQGVGVGLVWVAEFPPPLHRRELQLLRRQLEPLAEHGGDDVEVPSGQDGGDFYCG